MHNDNIPSSEEGTLDKNTKDLEKKYHTGKLIVLTIAIVNVSYIIIDNFIGNWNIIGIIFQIVLSMALYSGAKWGWGLFIIVSFFRALMIPLLFLQHVNQGLAPSAGDFLWVILGFIIAAVSFWLTAYNKRVSEFLSYQRNL